MSAYQPSARLLRDPDVPPSSNSVPVSVIVWLLLMNWRGRVGLGSRARYQSPNQRR